MGKKRITVLEKPRFCTECFQDAEVYEIDDGVYLCSECEEQYRRQIEEDMRNDPENFCKCGRFSDILENGKCPMCFEMGGYI